eukprot:44345-Eustigmatos_ZCMA.PRE.1
MALYGAATDRRARGASPLYVLSQPPGHRRDVMVDGLHRRRTAGTAAEDSTVRWQAPSTHTDLLR